MEILYSLLPALIVGALAYYFFFAFIKNENNIRRYNLLKENQKQSLPLRLQAYERLILFLERINPSKLLLRIMPNDSDKIAYSNLLIATIDQEFEHNLTQQIYISDECWSVLVATKNSITQLIKKTAEDTTINTSDEFREAVLKQLIKTSSPTTNALSFIKKEVKKFL